jgi:DNA-directed RNA polymerase specialized sigma24 family protein
MSHEIDRHVIRLLVGQALSLHHQECCLALLPRLTLQQKKAFVLTAFCHLKKTEVADVLGVSPPAISRLLDRIRRKASRLTHKEAA